MPWSQLTKSAQNVRPESKPSGRIEPVLTEIKMPNPNRDMTDHVACMEAIQLLREQLALDENYPHLVIHLYSEVGSRMSGNYRPNILEPHQQRQTARPTEAVQP